MNKNKGSVPDYLARFKNHNEGKSRYTSGKMPWKLIYVEEHSDKRNALIRERKLKRYNAEYFQWRQLSTKPFRWILLPVKALSGMQA